MSAKVNKFILRILSFALAGLLTGTLAIALDPHPAHAGGVHDIFDNTNATGKPLRTGTIRVLADGPHGNSTIEDLTVLPNGDLIWLDPGRHVLHQHSAQGQYSYIVPQVNGDARIARICVDVKRQMLYIVTQRGDAIHRLSLAQVAAQPTHSADLDNSDDAALVLKQQAPFRLPENMNLPNPHSLVMGKAGGELIVANRANVAILKLADSPEPDNSYAIYSPSRPFPTDQVVTADSKIVGIGSKRPGLLESIRYQTDASSIDDPVTFGRREGFSLEGSANPRMIASGQEGVIWYISTAGNIGFVTQETQRELRLPPGAMPASVALGPDGNMWSTLSGLNCIARIAANGQFAMWPIPIRASRPSGIVAGQHSMFFALDNPPRLASIAISARDLVTSGDMSRNAAAAASDVTAGQAESLGSLAAQVGNSGEFSSRLEQFHTDFHGVRSRFVPDIFDSGKIETLLAEFTAAQNQGNVPSTFSHRNNRLVVTHDCGKLVGYWYSKPAGRWRPTSKLAIEMDVIGHQILAAYPTP